MKTKITQQTMKTSNATSCRLFCRFISILILAVCWASIANAQYTETFSTPNKGYKLSCLNDFAGVNWTLTSWDPIGTCQTADLRDPTDYFNTTAAGILECIDLDQEVCWESPLMNISAAGTVTLSVGLTWAGFDVDVAAGGCLGDYIKVMYSVNGGAYTMVPNVVGGNSCATVAYLFSGPAGPFSSSTTVTQGGISGTNLKIRVCVFTNANAEIVTIDNVSVPTAGVTLNCNQPVLTTTQKNIVCNGANSGSVDLSVSGGAPGYTYAWSNGPVTQDLTGTPVGTYTVTVTDAAFCSQTKSVTLINSPIIHSADTSIASCGQANGTIDLSVSGGNAGYTYLWSNSNTNQDITVSAGTYSVIVTDASSPACTSTASYTVGAYANGPYNETFSISNKGYLINQVNNFFGVNWTMSPWTFDEPATGIGRDNGDYFQTTAGGKLEIIDADMDVCWISPEINTSGAGTYQFSVDLSWLGLDDEDYINVQYSINGGAFITIPNQFGGGAGTIQYAFPTVDQNGSWTVTKTALSGNKIQIKVCALMNSQLDIAQIDNVSIPQTISLCFGPSLSSSITNVTCSGGSNGVINLSVSGGTPGYTYAWSNGSTNQDLTGIATGTYSVVVTDAAMATSSAIFTITAINPSPTASCSHVDVSCVGANNGTASVIAGSGNGSFSYLWTGSGSQTTSTATGLPSGTYTVTVTSGPCIATCSTIISTMPDAIPPSISCPANISVTNDAGNCSAVVTYTAPVGTDNCPGATTTRIAGLASGSAFPVGTTTITHQVTDASGNTATCSFTITVNDTEAPTIACPSNISQANDIGICGAIVSYSTPIVSDNCPNPPSPVLLSGLSSGSTFPIGTSNVQYGAPYFTSTYDFAGLTSGASINGQDGWLGRAAGVGFTDVNTILVNNTTPFANPQSSGLGLLATGIGGNHTSFATRVDNANFSIPDFDPTGIMTIQFDARQTYWGNYFQFGYDVNANGHLVGANEMSFGIRYSIVSDNITLLGVGGVVLASVSSSSYSLDSRWRQFKISIDKNANGGSGSISLSFRDVVNNGPWIVAPVLQNINAGFNPSGTDASNPMNVNAMVYSHEAGDNSENSFLDNIIFTKYSVCSFNVTITDTELPTISCPSNISVSNDLNSCGAVVTYTPPVGTDNCPGSTTTQTAGLASGSTFPLGTTTNTWLVTDASGNTATCQQMVTVLDNQPPTAVCQNINVELNPSHTYTVTATELNNGSSDNCSGSLAFSIQSGQTTYSCADTGQTFPVVLVVTDSSGNTATCIGNVTVHDNTNPCCIPLQITCPANITVNNDLNACGAIVNFTATSTGSLPVYTYTQNPGTLFPIGTTTVKAYVTNLCSIDSCTFSVTVIDTTKPVITCPATLTIGANNTGCTYLGSIGTATATDNCTTAILTGPSPAGPYPVGTTNVTWTATDLSGNVSTCTQQVTINASPTLSSSTVSVLGCYTWNANGQTYTVSGTYQAILSNAIDCDSILTLNLTITPGVYINPKLFLCGPYVEATGLMHDSLRVLGLIQNTEPYSDLPYNKSPILEPNFETVSNAILLVSGNNAIVDWVFLELRSSSNPATVIANKRALIQRDGDIVSNVDGVSPIYFSMVPNGDYYVTVKHRNHLGIMSENAISLNGCSTTSVDFTTLPSVYTNLYLAMGPRKLIGSVYALWPGNANNNKNVKYNGLSNDKAQLLFAVGSGTPNNSLSPVYRMEDVNMDGKVRYNNSDNDRVVIITTIGVNTPNNIINQHTPN